MSEDVKNEAGEEFPKQQVVLSTKPFDVTLTDAEMAAVGKDAAAYSSAVMELERKLKQVKKDFAVKIDEGKLQRDKCLDLLRSGVDKRNVTVEETYDYETGEKISTRKDTGEEIGREPIPEGEQLSLSLDQMFSDELIEAVQEQLRTMESVSVNDLGELFALDGTNALRLADRCVENEWIEKQRGKNKPYKVLIYEALPEEVQEVVSEREQGDMDELVLLAMEILRKTKRASTGAFQRRLRIGYNRAAAVMDELETQGIVGPPDPENGNPREILIDLNDG